MGNTSQNLSSFSESKQRSGFDISDYPLLGVVMVGILGNTLAIVSIFRQKHLLKSNHYFLVFHLAICDLGWLLMIFIVLLLIAFTKRQGSIFGSSFSVCLANSTDFVFATAGLCMMLIISVCRHRGAVHPLKPAISRTKLRDVCVLTYIIALILGYGLSMPLCTENRSLFMKFRYCYALFVQFLFPTTFMTIVYCAICRALVKENKQLKRLFSNQFRSNISSSFKIQRHIRNRRTFFVCVSTVLCYALGWIPLALYQAWFMTGNSHLLNKFWVLDFALILRAAGSSAANPIIYRILDKRMFLFWRLCSKRKQGAR